MRLLAGISLLCFAVGPSCSTAPTTPLPPEEAIGLRLESSVSTPSLQIGETALLSFRLRNLTARPIGLTFPHSCQITTFIEAIRKGVVDPPGGVWVCATVISSLLLAPNAEVIVTREIRGGAYQLGIYTSVPLPVGRYRAYARLHPSSPDIELQSASVVFEVR